MSTRLVELLQRYKESITKRLEAEEDRNEQLQSQSRPEVKCKIRELREAEEQMKEIESRLGILNILRSWTGVFSLILTLLVIFSWEIY